MDGLVRLAGALAILTLISAVPSAAPLLACEAPAPVELARQVKERDQQVLLAATEVIRVGVGRASNTGEAVIQVYVAGPTDQTRHTLPADLEGIRVQIMETSEFRPR